MLARDPGGPLPALACMTGLADRLVGSVRLAVGGLTGVRRIAENAPYRCGVPARLAGPGRHALLCEPPCDPADRLAVLGIAAEHLTHDRRLGFVDLEERVRVLGLLDIPIAIWGASEDGHRAGPGAMQLPAATALSDLRPLVLGDHPLELAQQLILRRAGPLGLLREDDLDPRPLELLEQQHLVCVPAREPIRRVTQQHLEPALDRQIT